MLCFLTGTTLCAPKFAGTALCHHLSLHAAGRCAHPRRRIATLIQTNTMLLKRKTAAAVVIGDEILTGKTQDTNTQTLARFLVSNGVVLKKTETILDDIETISSTVRRLSSSHDLVFTSGGIGPTLDDVTYAGVAGAFGLEMGEHADTVAMMRRVQPEMELNAARRRMAELPRPCETFWTEGLWVPLCCVGGKVYVLPGIPRLFERMLAAVPAERLGGVQARARRVVLCDLAEGDIAAALDRAKERNGDVAIGSYPATSESMRRRYRTKITFEGDDEGEVAEAADEVCRAVDGRMQEVEVGVDG